jgi:predicted Rdx family selenoprotein
MPTLTARGLRPPLPDSGSTARRRGVGCFAQFSLGSLLRASVGLAFLMISCPASGDMLARRDQQWASRFESLTTGAEDVARTVVVDGDGHVLVVGTTDDRRSGTVCLIQKFDGATGQRLWERVFSDFGAVTIGEARLDRQDALVLAGVGPARGASTQFGTYFLAKISGADGAVLWKREGPGANSRSEGQQAKLAVDGAGDVVLAGATFTATSGFDTPSYVGKYRGSDGSLLWERITEGVYELPKALACDSKGDVVMASSAPRVLEHGLDFVVAKLAAATGQLVWEARYNGPENGPDEPAAMATDGADHVIVIGKSSGPTGSPTSFATVKFDSADGSMKWERRHRGPTGWDQPTGVAVDAQDAVVVTGISPGQSLNLSDIYTAKYASDDGSVLWDRRWPATGFSGGHPVRVTVDTAGDVVVAGTSGSQSYTAKYAAASGGPIWEKSSDVSAVGTVALSSLVIDPMGAVVVAGTASFEPDLRTNPDFLIVKLAAADGAMEWHVRHDGPAQAEEKAVAVAIDPAGNVVSTGFVETPATGRDFLTRKLAAATGAEMWRRTHNGAANGRDEAGAVAVDATGAVVVAGVTTVAVRDGEELGAVPGDPDLYAAKYASADGALLWERRYDGPAGGADELVAMVLDQAGNVLITAYSTSAASQTDYYTAKYASSDGALIWERRHDGPASGTDHPVALVVDADGHVVVTGYTETANGKTQWFTIKYAGGDGSILWAKADDGGSDGRPTALAVDGQGDVGVAGFIKTEATGVDTYTAKYAAATGAVLWSRTFTSAGRRDDRVDALAMTAEGDLLVAGTSHPSGFAGPVPVLMLYGSAGGDIRWEQPFTEDLPEEGTTYALVATSTGHFLTLGSQYFLNAPQSLVVTARSLADGALLDMNYVGVPPQAEWANRAFGPQAIAVDESGRVAVAAGIQAADPGDQDSFTILFVPGHSPATLALVEYERFASGSWRITGKTNSRRICALEYSDSLTGWAHYGLMVADERGTVWCDNWSNVPQFFLRMGLPPWEAP